MRVKICLVLGIAAFFLFFPRAASAGPRASVSGVVADESAHPVQGAKLILRRQTDNGSAKPKEYKTGTDSKGNFNFGNVDTGTYEISCEKEGFRPEKRLLYLTLPEPRAVAFTLMKDAVSNHMVRLSKVDPKTARVFITYASMDLKTDKPDSEDSDSGSLDLPYTTLPELGALLHGGKITDEVPSSLPNPNAPPSTVLESLNQNNVSLLDVNSHQIVAVLPTPASPIWIAFSGDGNRFWVIDSMRNLSMYDGSGDLKNTVNVGQNLVTDFVVGSNRLYLASRTWPAPAVLLVDASNNALVGNFPLPAGRGQPGGMALSRDGRILLVTLGTTTKGWLEILDAGTGRVVKEMEVGAQPLGVAMTPDGSRGVVADYSGAEVDVIDLLQQKIVNRIPTGIMPARVGMRPDGRVAFVSNNGDNSLSVIDTASGTLIRRVPVGKGPLGVAVAPDGSTVYVANHDSANVTTVDGSTFAVLSTSPQTSGAQVFGVAVRP